MAIKSNKYRKGQGGAKQLENTYNLLLDTTAYSGKRVNVTLGGGDRRLGDEVSTSIPVKVVARVNFSIHEAVEKYMQRMVDSRVSRGNRTTWNKEGREYMCKNGNEKENRESKTNPNASGTIVNLHTSSSQRIAPC